MVRGVIHSANQAGFCQTKFEGTEFTRKELDDLNSLWGWHKNAVDTVDDTISSELLHVS